MTRGVSSVEEDAVPSVGATRSLLVVSHRVDEALAHTLGELTNVYTVRLGFLSGPAPDADRVRAKRLTSTAPTGGGRLLLNRFARTISSVKRQMRRAALGDAWLDHALRAADHIILVDDVADELAAIARMRAPGARVSTSARAATDFADQLAWTRLHQALATKAGKKSVDAVMAALTERVETPPVTPLPLPLAVMYQYLDQLLRGSQRHRVLDVVALLAQLPGVAEDDAALAAARAVGELGAAGETDADVAATAGACLAAADRALERNDLATASCLTSLALRLAFHRELHSDSVDSPLVHDPARFLAPLRATHTWQLLTAPAQVSAAHPERNDSKPRVTVSMGPYPRFAAPLIDAVGAAAELVTVEPPAVDRRFGSIQVDTDLVDQRLRAALGLTDGAFTEWADTFEGADIVVADWADKAAVLAALFTPSTSRLILRVHGVDALRCWIHLIDWSRVDEVIVVSEHMADLLAGLLGSRLPSTGRHVVGNTPARAFHLIERARTPRTLGMVGWSRRVKDPLWAVEVLAALLRADDRWRLVLIGHDFPEGGPASGRNYADRFRCRVAESDVRDRIQYAGFTDDVPAALAQVDFIISASIRESFHLGVLEAATTGAVPVVRNWPQVAHLDAARRLYPASWVVDDVSEAVQRMSNLSTPTAFVAESERAAQAALGLASPKETTDRLRSIILGD